MTLVALKRHAPATRDWLTRRQVAKLIGVTVHCVEKWAERKIGPRFYRTKRSRQGRAFYRIEDVEDFLHRRCNDATLPLSASAIPCNGLLLHEPNV
jgi:hypothetical protein